MARILYLDIETSPNLGYTWAKWDQNVIEFVQEWDLIGFAYAWDDGRVRSVYPTTYDGEHTLKDWEPVIMEQLWELLDKADIVVAHNGDKFDLKKINTKLIYHGHSPPSPYQTIDTLKVWRSVTSLNSYKLDDIGEYFGLGRKIKHDGFVMWTGCLAGDPRSYKAMAKYNRQDVVLLRDVYKLIRGWMKNHPHVGGEGCPACGSLEAQRRGFRKNKSGITYQQFQCTSCGSYYREVSRDSAPTFRS